jgi:hypothetical protein
MRFTGDCLACIDIRASDMPEYVARERKGRLA